MPAIRTTSHLKTAHAGRLHRELHLPVGQPIPAAKPAEALPASDPAERKQAQFAENARQFHPPKKGE